MQKTAKEKRSIIRATKRYYSKGIRKLLRRKGHGVHSPFVYNFIIRIIEEKARFYAYEQIEEVYKQVKQRAKAESLPKPLSLKYHKLLYRISNRIKPQTILECGSDNGVSTTALAMAKSDTQIITIDTDFQKLLSAYFEKTIPNLIYIHKQSNIEDYKIIYSKITQQLPENQCIVVSGIRRTKQSYNLFKEFVSNNTIKVTIDLYDIAILVASPKLNKQTFRVSF